MPSMAEIGGMIAATTVATCSVLRCTAAAQSAGSDGSGTGAIEAAADALRAELGALSLREVRRRAEQAGVGAGRLDEALESADPKRATIELILQHRQREEEGRAGDDAALRAELAQLKLGALYRRAEKAGVEPAALDAAEDEADPRAAIVRLLLQRAAPPEQPAAAADEPTPPEAAALRSELQAMRVKGLERRAMSDGVSADAVEA